MTRTGWSRCLSFTSTSGRRAASPCLDEYIRSQAAADRWFQTLPEERVRQRVTRPNYWFGPGDTLDRATSMIPRLLNERLPDFGIDFAVV